MRLDRNVLAAALVVTLAALTIYYMRPEPPAFGQPTIPSKLTIARPNIDPLRLDVRALAASAAPHRNIFTFDDPPVVHAAPVRRTVITQQPEKVAFQAPVTHNDVPTPPTFPWHCIGRFGPDNAPFVALANDAHEVLNARGGETVGGQFIVRSIGVESVEIGFVGFPATAGTRIAIGH
ncbi:MAG: hypothetical protein QOI24_1605 [Acidobacteriota bacterium]|jgi:hypothetical protein|nr:hypothetical protein [Acidobacteriota bacterium]